MTSTNPGSLRELYVDPNQTWSFIKQSDTKIYTPRSKHSPTSVYSLSPTLSPDGPEYREPEGVPLAHVFKSFVASFVLQYTSTAIVMPWEVGKMLLQVQWVPRDAGEEVMEEQDGEKDMRDDDTEDDETESYFAEPDRPARRAIVDEDGHIVRRSVLEEGTRPEYIIPVGSASGVWGMMKRAGRYRTEGWLCLWKGLLTSCVTEILSDTLQPIMNVFLQSLLFPRMSAFERPPILLGVCSHLLTGIILSPLDLIRTRLIIQSSTAKYRRYSGPMDALKQIVQDEGGVMGMYLHPQLVIPTILDNGLRPLVALALPGMLTRYSGWGHIREDTHSIGWGLAELAGSCLGLVVTLPIETIRRRLQAQVRGNGRSMKGCVELRPKPYNGVVDALWHILTEERSDLPISGYESWWRHTGIGQLYRGMGMRLCASGVVFILALFGSVESENSWAEI